MHITHNSTGPKWHGFSVVIETDLVIVWVVETDLISG